MVRFKRVSVVGRDGAKELFKYENKNLNKFHFFCLTPFAVGNKLCIAIHCGSAEKLLKLLNIRALRYFSLLTIICSSFTFFIVELSIVGAFLQHNYLDREKFSHHYEKSSPFSETKGKKILE
jgi:hypothetical protein